MLMDDDLIDEYETHIPVQRVHEIQNNPTTDILECNGPGQSSNYIDNMLLDSDILPLSKRSLSVGPIWVDIVDEIFEPDDYQQ